MNNLPHIMPFLWVHGEDEATYRKLIGAIYDASLRAFCVEARPHDGFLGETWWRDMDIILDEAERRGMKVWILDDKHFPTGYAAGMAAKAPLEQRRQSLLHKVWPVRKNHIRLHLEKCAHPPVSRDPMTHVCNMINKNLTPDCRFKDDRWYSISAIQQDGPRKILDLSDHVRGGILDWTAPEGKWEVHLCYLSRNVGAHHSYINMMDAESCRIQIDTVYESHYAHYGEKFGKVIAGFFSDEPELGNNRMYLMNNTLGTEQDLPWSRELESALRERLGEQMPELLPLLWCNCGNPKWTAGVRYHYMDCVSRLVEKDFSRQIGRWCQEHGVEYIGHVVEDNNQHARTGTSLGHYFRGLKWQTMAGIDDIGEYTDLGDPCIGDKSATTFSSQITSVIQLPGTDRYIACADRWMPQWYVKPMAKQIISGMERHFKDYKPDTTPKTAAPLPGAEIRHSENTSISRYVWLPITWQGDKPVIQWQNEWHTEKLGYVRGVLFPGTCLSIDRPQYFSKGLKPSQTGWFQTSLVQVGTDLVGYAIFRRSISFLSGVCA